MSVPGPEGAPEALELVEAPRSWVPIPKVSMGGFTGALTVIVEWLLGDIFHIQVPAPVLGAAPVVVFFLVAYLTPHPAQVVALPLIENAPLPGAPQV